ncbi:flavin reductase family protein [Rhodococcus koreensis]
METEFALSNAELRRCYGGFPTGVVATGTLINGTPVGMAVSAFAPISLDPPLVGLFFQRTSSTWPVIRDEASHVGLSFLSASHTSEVAALSAKVGDRFDDVDYEVRGSGAIVVRDSLEWLDVTVDDVIGIGDHELAVMRVHEISTNRHHDDPMVFFGSKFCKLVETPSPGR